LIPNALEGAPAPLRIVFTTVFVLGPAALLLVFGAATADGSIANKKTMVSARKDLLAFMVHRNFCVGISV
jgi:hypothetical protein